VEEQRVAQALRGDRADLARNVEAGPDPVKNPGAR
jgi:hypothetical protein